MTAGMGIVHSESAPKEFLETGGELELIQLWVNLPAELKMSRPRYQNILAEDIPQISRKDGIIIKLISGEVENIHGPVTEIEADPIYLDVTVPSNSVFEQPVEIDHTVFAYVFEGQGQFGWEGAEKSIGHPRLVVFGNGDFMMVRTTDNHVRFLLISGKPLDEPIARYGPFVMNTQEEIQQALQDLRNGTFVAK